jgi:hypothetical protein
VKGTTFIGILRPGGNPRGYLGNGRAMVGKYKTYTERYEAKLAQAKTHKRRAVALLAERRYKAKKKTERLADPTYRTLEDRRRVCKRGHARTQDNLNAQGACKLCLKQSYIPHPRPTKRQPDTVDFMVAAINRKLYNSRKSAKERGLEFSITFFDFPELPMHCPVLGIKLDYFGGDGSNNASIDRIDSTKGYVPGNVHIISWRANMLKSNATVNELKKVYEYFSSL